MKEYAYEHLKLMMLDKAATVIQATDASPYCQNTTPEIEGTA